MEMKSMGIAGKSVKISGINGKSMETNELSMETNGNQWDQWKAMGINDKPMGNQ